ncbi:hypothetical protein Tco_1547066 [Tanacetum coccineum]
MRTSVPSLCMVGLEQLWDRNGLLGKMAVQNQYMNVLNLRSLITEKLNGTNFLDWHKSLRIILGYEGKLALTETPLPDHLIDDAPAQQAEAYRTLLKEMEDHTAYDMVRKFKGMLQTQASQELYDTQRQQISRKMEEN